VVGKISSPFGWRRHPVTRRRDFHTGIDVRAPRGREIKAAKAGRVEYAGWMGGYGRVVVIRHNDGYSTLYAHCNSLSVRNGQSVSQGQTIASVGTSGRTTGPHLHFEIRQGKSPMNPLKLLR
jgi:murein DD-endopeptidase MepM/ murein hydrolase activator NlpD